MSSRWLCRHSFTKREQISGSTKTRELAEARYILAPIQRPHSLADTPFSGDMGVCLTATARSYIRFSSLLSTSVQIAAGQNSDM